MSITPRIQLACVSTEFLNHAIRSVTGVKNYSQREFILDAVVTAVEKHVKEIPSLQHLLDNHFAEMQRNPEPRAKKQHPIPERTDP